MPHLFTQLGGMAVGGRLPFLKNENGFVVLRANCDIYKS